MPTAVDQRLSVLDGEGLEVSLVGGHAAHGVSLRLIDVILREREALLSCAVAL